MGYQYRTTHLQHDQNHHIFQKRDLMQHAQMYQHYHTTDVNKHASLMTIHMQEQQKYYLRMLI